MEWIDIMTIIGVNIAIMAIMTTLIVWAVNRMDSHADSLGKRLDSHARRIDQLYHTFVDETKAQSIRTDKLYEMFIELIKKGEKK